MFSEPRLYRDQHDLEGMHNILVEGRKADTPVYYVHVGDLHWWLFYLDPDFQERTYIWENERDGRVIGWALFSHRFGTFDVFVHPAPEFFGQRISFFDWAVEKAGGILREQGRKSVSTMWISEHDPQLIAHLDSRGFVQSERHMIYMQQSLDEIISGSELPPGYYLRHVEGEHEAERRAMASHAAFGSRKPIERHIEGYRQFMRSSVYVPELDLVAVSPNGQFAAFCIVWLDKVNRLGYFEPVGTHPDFRQRGLGAALLKEGMRLMKAQGMRTASVCVESDNLAANKLYESVGFKPILRIQPYTL